MENEFNKIFDLYSDTVYSYIRFKVKDAYLVEDIVQDTFLSIYLNMNDLPKIHSIKAWILTIARRRMVDRLRKTKNESLSLLTSDSIAKAEYTGLDDNLFVDELLNQLDEVSRDVIYGIYVEGLTYKDMAKILELPEGTIKSKSHYARAKLREWLKEDKSYEK